MQANAPAKEGLSLELRRMYPHSMEKVFRALTEPAQIMQWFGPQGCEMVSAEVDPKAGGAYCMTMRRLPDGPPHSAFGKYEEIQPHRLLRFSWQWEGLPGYEGVTRVTITLAEVNGMTELVLRHEGFAEERHREGHQWGWEGGLTNLGTVLDSANKEGR